MKVHPRPEKIKAFLLPPRPLLPPCHLPSHPVSKLGHASQPTHFSAPLRFGHSYIYGAIRCSSPCGAARITSTYGALWRVGGSEVAGVRGEVGRRGGWRNLLSGGLKEECRGGRRRRSRVLQWLRRHCRFFKNEKQTLEQFRQTTAAVCRCSHPSVSAFT